MIRSSNHIIDTIDCDLTSCLFKARRETFDASQISSDEEKKEEKVPLDSDALLTLTYWFFVIIACLIAVGLSWDLWMYWKENIHAHHGSEQQGISAVALTCHSTDNHFWQFRHNPRQLIVELYYLHCTTTFEIYFSGSSDTNHDSLIS
jgi:hypothetical protein